jgi:hypothetical protein
MRDNDCGSTCHYSQSKNLPRMTKDCIRRANGHQVVTFYPEKLSFKTLVLFEGRWEDGVAYENPIPDLEQNDASPL